MEGSFLEDANQMAEHQDSWRCRNCAMMILWVVHIMGGFITKENPRLAWITGTIRAQSRTSHRLQIGARCEMSHPLSNHGGTHLGKSLPLLYHCSSGLNLLERFAHCGRTGTQSVAVSETLPVGT